MKDAVLITGGSSGIGAAAVRRFRGEGYPVAFVYGTSDEAAKKLAEETGALALRADVSDREMIRAAIREAQRKLGFIGTLINNAGIAQFRMFQDITEFEWRRMLDVHLTGAFFATQAVIEEMISNRRGVVLNVSSMWGQVGASCEVHYSAAKAGLIGFTKALAKEVGPSGVRVNCVAPGVIETGMIGGLSEEEKSALAEETPLGRLGTAEDVADTLWYLASAGSAFITGQVISPNGGFVI